MKQIQYINSNAFAPKDPWGALSISDKASIIRAGVESGYTKLSDIRAKYNEFAEGGELDLDTPSLNIDDTLTSAYIRAIENPDSIGYKNGKWYQSTRKADDKNNRGMGVDIKYNNQAKALTEGREGRFLTEEEERKLRNDHTQYTLDILEKHKKDFSTKTPSPMKTAMAAGILYRGDGMKTLKSPAIREAYNNGSDEDMMNAITDFYNKKRMSRRAQLHTAFVMDYLNKKKNKEEDKKLYGHPYTPVLRKVQDTHVIDRKGYAGYGDGGPLVIVGNELF